MHSLSQLLPPLVDSGDLPCGQKPLRVELSKHRLEKPTAIRMRVRHCLMQPMIKADAALDVGLTKNQVQFGRIPNGPGHTLPLLLAQFAMLGESVIGIVEKG